MSATVAAITIVLALVAAVALPAGFFLLIRIGYEVNSISETPPHLRLFSLLYAALMSAGCLVLAAEIFFSYG